MDIALLHNALAELLSSSQSLYIFLGVIIGLGFGVIPGLGGTTALALLIPITYTMNSDAAMYLAGGSMGAVAFGGSISAILLNTPGTAPNAATIFDGYPLACQGKAGVAIGAAATASALGGIIGLVSLLLVIPLARDIIYLFGPPEFLLLTLLGLVAIAVATRGKLLRGLIAGGIGLLFAFVGMDSVSGEVRFTLGINYLWDGISLVPVLTGMFAISQMIELAVKGGSIASDEGRHTRITGVGEGILSVFRHWPVLLRGSAIGTVIGAIPGLGGTVAAFLSYTTAVQVSEEPETFGKGNIIGVIAPESANNAKDGASLLPTVAFGIPGSAETALLLSILILHGIEPGPSILLEHQHEVYALILAITAAAVSASIIGLLVARWLVLITYVRVQILVPVVIAVSLTAVYVLEGKPGDMIVCAIMGIIGYLMMRFDYPRLTLVIALVLGGTMERALHQCLTISNGHLLGYIGHRPVSLILVGCIILTLLLPTWRSLRRSGRTAGAES